MVWACVLGPIPLLSCSSHNTGHMADMHCRSKMEQKCRCVPASQTNGLTCFHGTMVTPSGRLPWSLSLLKQSLMCSQSDPPPTTRPWHCKMSLNLVMTPVKCHLEAKHSYNILAWLGCSLHKPHSTNIHTLMQWDLEDKLRATTNMLGAKWWCTNKKSVIRMPTDSLEYFCDCC